MCKDAKNVGVGMRRVLKNYSISVELKLACFFPSAQIIYKLKRHNDPSVTGNIDDICDRIFELVDKNKDSKFQVDYNTQYTNPLFLVVLP